MKNLKPLFSLFILFLFYHNISLAQCPNGVEASLIFSGPSSCQCVTATATGGVPPYSYSWSGGQIANTICAFASGVYTLVVTDALGCTDDTVFQLSGSSFVITANSTPAFCRNGTATVATSGGIPPFQYNWNTNPVQTDSVATGLHAGVTYNVTVTDDSGCVLMQQVYVPGGGNLNSGISYNPDTCGHGVGAATGYAVSGIPPYSYLWSTGDTVTSLSNLTSGFYSFTVTDDSGCVSTASQSVINYSPVQISHSEVQPSCTNDSGSITLNASGGTFPYNYFWNTIPPQITNVASNLIIGFYNCLVTDAAGCTATVGVLLNDNSNLMANASSLPDTCNKGVGVATAFASGGTPPYLYKWNQLSASANPVLSNRYPGHNTVWVTDDSGCVRKANAYVNYYSPMNVVASGQNASCIFTANGTASAGASGGILPYTYLWTNGSTTSSATGFFPGHYSVYVTDSQGCADYASVNIGYDSIAPCAVIVEGTVFNDTSMNCIKDAGETTIGNVMISCLPYGGYKWTDAIGYYKFYLPPGNYTTSQGLPPWHTLFCPSTDYHDTLPVVGMDTVNDFADVGDAVDLDINCFGINFPVPGFDYHQSVYYRNQGTKAVPNTYVTVHHDSRITFLYSQPAASNYNSSTNTITIPVGNLTPYGNFQSWQGQAIVHYNIPSSLTIGTLLSFTDTIFPVAGDTVPLNNQEYCFANVVGPYDPNSIEVTPHGDGLDG